MGNVLRIELTIHRTRSRLLLLRSVILLCVLRSTSTSALTLNAVVNRFAPRTLRGGATIVEANDVMTKKEFQLLDTGAVVDDELSFGDEGQRDTFLLNALNDTVTVTDVPPLANGNSQAESLGEEEPTTTRKLWRRRHARSFAEGIRREKASELSSLLKKAHQETFNANRRLVARTLTGFISALAEESDGLEVEVKTDTSSPLWEKKIDSLRISFSRLGFRPLRLGGLNNAITKLEDALPSDAKTVLTEELEMTSVSSMDEAFDRIDVDNSGTLDSDEIATALDMVTSSDSSDQTLLTSLASELVELYDTNGDGVVDFEEYQLMVQDMAELRRVQQARTQERQDKADVKNGKQASKSNWFNKSKKEGALHKEDSSDKLPIQGSGTITLSDLKLDLRRLLFGAVPLLKSITPGGPLVLEPFTATVSASVSQDDVMESFLIDAGLRRLVARALRRRVRSYRDLVDGALFYGRQWNMASTRAPVIEVPSLTQVEFDSNDRLIMTGRAMIRASPDAPPIESAFKVRTRLGTRMNGQVIRLEQPELALVLECPKAWERNIASACEKLNMPVPSRPTPLYSFFPIYSPFKVEDNDGFDMGPDNRIKSIFIKDGALRFQMESIMRPGRFLGSHYVAFTVPIRTFLVTLDRVMSGVRSARRNKREAKAARKNRRAAVERRHDAVTKHRVVERPRPRPKKTPLAQKRPKKSFFSRFVEGYTGVGKDEVVRNERLTVAISEWFGRQDADNGKY